MSNTKSTKRALLSSVMAIVLCLAMLIGTTFAWFTDTASTAVNRIQAGTLDIALEMKDANGDWVNAEGKTLNFLQKQANGTVTQGTNILWEPGCTYELPELRVVNNGNLALKYKVIITGIAGDAKLNEAIEWTMVLDGNTYNIADEHELAAKTDAGIDFDVLTIKGHMKEDAGNEYQGLSIDGISITVIATQLNSENDSFGSDYDGRAEYNKKNVTIMADDGKTITLENSKTYTVGNGTVVVAANGDITYTNSVAAQTVTINTDGGKLTVNAPNDTVYHYGESDFVDIAAVADNSFHEFGKVGVLSVTKGRVVIEKGDNVVTTQVKGNEAIIAVPENVVLDTKLEKAEDVNEVTLNVIDSNGNAIADKSVTTRDGTTTETVPDELKEVLNVAGKTIEDAKNYVAINGETCYDSLQAAVKVGGTVKLLNHVLLKDTLEVKNTVTINMNRYSITGEGVRAIHVKEKTLTLDGVGTVSSTVEDVGSSVIRVGDNNATSNASLYVKKGVTISTETAYGITAFGKKNESVHVYGTVTSTAPENTAYDGCAISTVGNDTTKSYIYIYDGASVSAAHTNAIYMPSGNLTVNGGTITGRTGIYVKSGSTTISGGTIIGNGPATEYNYYGNGGISTGDALVVDSCGYPNGVPSVTVSGGTFTSVNAKAVASYNTEDNTKVVNFISGGKFSTRPETEYVKTGYVVDKSADGYYTVITCTNHVNNAGYCDNCRYEFPFYGGTGTKKDPYLINNAHHLDSLTSTYSGKYFKLMKDITVTGDNNRFLYNGTLDGGGHRITVKDNDETTFRYLFYSVNNSTIKNLEVDLDYSLAYNSSNVVFDDVDVYGSFNATGNEGAYLIYAENGATFIDCNSYATLYGNGDSSNYNAVFVGYPHGGTFKFTNCTNEGSLSCGKAAMFIANGSYDKVTLIINKCKNNGTIQAAYVTSNVNDYFPNYFRAVTNDGKGGSLIDVTVDGKTYEGNNGSANALNGSNVEQILTGENGKFINGPMDKTLALTRNADGTFTITPASAKGVAKYEISIGMYATIRAGGSCREFIQEVIEVTNGATSYTSTIKDFAFVDQKWVSKHSDAVIGTLNGYTIYTLNGTSYYYLLDAVSNTVNGNPRPLSLFGVTAYDSSGNLVAAAALRE